MNNYLEYQIDKLIEKINNMGYHAHKNHANRNFDGVYVEGEPYDYDIFLPNYKACFDAKMCEKGSYSIMKKDIKQINNLIKCKRVGMNAFFLIYFVKTKQLLKFDVELIKKILESGKKSINKNLGEKWDVEKLIGGANE